MNLKTIQIELILLKRFASDESVLRDPDVVVNGDIKTVSTYIEAPSINLVYSPLHHQNYTFLKKRLFNKF